MAKPRKFLLRLDRAGARRANGSHLVHVSSRTAAQDIWFGDEEKEMFQGILFKQLAFSGLRVMAWCFMGNDFHLLLEVPDKEEALAALGQEGVLSRLSVFSDEPSTQLLMREVEDCREAGDTVGQGQIAERVAARLSDLSIFMKELKMKMTLAYNSVHGRRGGLWAGRFKSVLVQGDEALRAVAANIDLKPIRAGLVKQPEDYRWCSYAAAVGGMRLARAGLISAISFEKKIRWKQAVERYQKFLSGIGQEHGGRTAGRAGSLARLKG